MKPILSLQLAVCGAVAWLNHTALGAGKPDTTPPAAVTDLTVTAVTHDSVMLTWTATADDGNNPASGAAKRYYLRYSYAPITEQNWDSAFRAFCTPVPQPAGSLQSYTLEGLLNATTYYIRLKVADEVPNLSALSNEATATTVAGAQTWSIDWVEVSGVGTRSDLEFDPRDGNPSIAYKKDGYLTLAHWNGSTWNIEVIDSFSATTSEGIDLVFEPMTGFPTVSYSQSYSTVKFARWGGSSWVLETVDNKVNQHNQNTSLAYDPAGRPSIAYMKHVDNTKLGNKFMFAVKVGSSWSLETVEAGVGAYYNSMAYDGNGNPTIAYSHSTDAMKSPFDTLKFARKSGGLWITEVVVSSPGVVREDLDMKYDPMTGYPTISYTGGSSCTQADVLLSRWDGSQWTTEVVAPASGACVYETSLAFDSGGVPRVAFNSSSGCLVYINLAKWNGLAWEIEDVMPGLINRGSLEIDPLGRPALSQRAGELRYLLRNAP